MKTNVMMSVLALAMTAGAAMAQVSTINNLNTVGDRFYNDRPGSSLTTTHGSGLSGVRWVESNTAAGGFANRHFAPLAVNGTPYSFGAAESWQMDVDVIIRGPQASEAGIMVGTTPFYPSSFGANTGQFVMLPGNAGEIATFGGEMPFFSNNQPQNAGMARSSTGTWFHMTLMYVGTNDGAPFVKYGVNGVFAGPENAAGTFAGWSAGTAVGVFTQNNFGAFGGSGQFDVEFANISIQGIPAPASAALLGLGGLVAARRRRA